MSEKPTVGRITQLSDKPYFRPAKLAPTAPQPTPIIDPNVAVIDELRALCGEAGIWILSHQTFLDSHGENGQSQALIKLGAKLRAAAEGRKA